MRQGRYLGNDYDWHDCEVLERNGNLTLVQDEETGEEEWLAPHELDDYDNDS